MNKVILMGRLTREPELKTTSNGNSVCQFSLAVERRFKNANGERQADFINCTAWRQTAEFITRYFPKGAKILVVGSIQVSNYEDKDGKRQYRTDVMIDEAYFVESKDAADAQNAPQNASGAVNQYQGARPRQTQNIGGFAQVDDALLPFDL